MREDGVQLTLFEPIVCDGYRPRKPAADHTSPDATPESNSLIAGSNSSCPQQDYVAISLLAGLALFEVCAACGCQIIGSGFVILDYEELGAFCDQDCGDERFRAYLCEASEDATLSANRPRGQQTSAVLDA